MALTLFLCVFAAVLSAPLYPVLGSALFLVGYMRSVRFWELGYRTPRVAGSDAERPAPTTART